jgi:hypothetical protein
MFSEVADPKLAKRAVGIGQPRRGKDEDFLGLGLGLGVGLGLPFMVSWVSELIL